MNEPRSGLYTKGGAGVPLQGVEVEAAVFGGHATVKVRQRYVNLEAVAVEAVYTFPRPSDGTLTGFAMSCAGRRLQGVVKARDDAFREYDEAVSQGHGAALIDQERANLFTAQVGNLLPNEETIVEVELVQKLRADEGLLRWSIPTLVAPRCIPGSPKGNRTAHGAAEPTDRVPDADRITPPIGDVAYGLKLEVVFDLGAGVRVESPSHAVTTVAEDGGRIRVSFSSREVALDRDVVLTARNVERGPFTTVAAHRADGPGTFALTVIPDLFEGKDVVERQDVVFLIDTSGSMDGASISEARSALRLCLRHLREGDRFNIISFNSAFRVFSPGPVVFTQRTLEQADTWVGALTADGGTELLAPLVHALKNAPNGIVVLLTDGQVGNEAEILREALAVRQRARVYSFGIGTNVSDPLLRDLARETHGAVEFIHPGERIDEKVTAQFARAIAPQIEEVSVTFDGVDVQELSPAPIPPLVDGEPWVLFGRYTRAGRGRAELKGVRHEKSGPLAFSLAVDLTLPERAAAPHVEKLWARERIRDLERARLTGRRAEANKERITKLAVEYQVVTEFTSFLVVEHRAGDRLSSGQPQTRVIPVNMPAGWDMFKQPHHIGHLARIRIQPAACEMVLPAGRGVRAAAQASSTAGTPTLAAAGGLIAADSLRALETSGRYESVIPEPTLADPVLLLLQRQLASGLWEPSGGGDDTARALATARALLELLDQGITTSHRIHGAQVRKAVAALVATLPHLARADAAAAEFAACVAWLVAPGPRSRRQLEDALQKHAALRALRPSFDDEVALRTRVDALDQQLR
jgi:Ca-activated chloride channel family protein